MKRKNKGAYPPDWKAIARQVKEAAGWCCVRCGAPHDPASGHTLTVHHCDIDPSHSELTSWWFNLLPLCQRCHLSVQGRVDLDRPWVWEHSPWFQPYVAGHYARKYLGVHLSRSEVEARLDELLALERQAVLGE